MREKILKLIEKNPKLNLKDISAMLEVDEITVANEIADMEKEKIICGYYTLINWEKTSNEKVIALIELKVTPQRGLGFDKVAQRIASFGEVSSVYLMSGGFDITVIIEGKTMREVANFVATKLSPIETVISTSTHFVLRKYKESGTLLFQNKDQERMAITP